MSPFWTLIFVLLGVFGAVLAIIGFILQWRILEKAKKKKRLWTAFPLMLGTFIVGIAVTLVAITTIRFIGLASVRSGTIEGEVFPHDSLLIGSTVTLKDASTDTVISIYTVTDTGDYKFRFPGLPLNEEFTLELTSSNIGSLIDTVLIISDTMPEGILALDLYVEIIPPIQIFLDLPEILPGDSVSWSDDEIKTWIDTSHTRDWKEDPKQPLYGIGGRIVNPPPNGRVAVDLYGGEKYWPQSRRPIDEDGTWKGEVCLTGQYAKWDMRLRVYVYTIEAGEVRIHAREDFYIVVESGEN